MATSGIIIFYKLLLNWLDSDKLKKHKIKIKKSNIENIINNIFIKIKEIIAISISVQICILPLNICFFNKISLTFLASNILVSFFIGTIIIFGFVSIIIPAKFVFFIINIMLNTLKSIAKFFANIPLSKIVVITPSFWQVITYYSVILVIVYINILKKKADKRVIERRILTIVDKFKCAILKKKHIYIIIIVAIFITVQILSRFSTSIKVHFIDVGQGDATLIVTPLGKTILIDGGGSTNNYDVGKNILLPYLLDRGITRINYMIISHFDTDHVDGLKCVLENIRVDKVVISKQAEKYEEYINIVEIIKRKNIDVIVVKVNDSLNIEKDVLIEILYPENKLKFSDINNNSIVAKLIYKKFSILFTGDIEKDAEKILIKNYKTTNKLQSTIIKVPHHGSNTSSTEEFIENVKPQIALIGVGKNNKFGHPSDIVIKTLKKFKVKIYRTDECGEITVESDGNKINAIYTCI